MKLKYYLRGLGLGIIFTSIILAVAYSQNKGLITDSEVMKRASELGMVSTETESNGLFEQEDTENTGRETEGETSQQPEQTSQQQVGASQQSEAQNSQQEGTSQETQVQASPQEQTSQQSGTQSSEQATSQQSQTVGNQQSSEQTVQMGEDEPEYIVIRIVPGEVCRQVAEELKAHELVDDAEKFRKYMEENNYDNFIRVGSVPIKRGASYEEIAIALTTKQ